MHVLSLSRLSIATLVSLVLLSPLAYADFATGVIVGSALGSKSEKQPNSVAKEVITYNYRNGETHKHIFAANKWSTDKNGNIRICPGDKAVYRHYRITDQTRCVIPRDGLRGFMGSMMQYPDVSLEDYLRMTTAKEPTIASIDIVQHQQPGISVTYTLGEGVDASAIRQSLIAEFNQMHREPIDHNSESDWELWVDIHWTSLCIGLALGIAAVRLFAVLTAKEKREDDEWISKRKNTVAVSKPARARKLSSSSYQPRATRNSEDGLVAGVVIGSMMSDSTSSDTSSSSHDSSGCSSD